MLRLFLTANDTDAGKTFVATRLIAALQRSGVTVAARKPVESGWDTQDPANTDAAQLAQVSAETLDQVCRYRYCAPLAPVFAAEAEGQTLTQAMLLASLDADADLLLIEGAGGLLSPLTQDGDNADFASTLNAPVLIVVRERLGAINQGRMALQSAMARKLKITGLIVNGGALDDPRAIQNAETLAADLARYTETGSAAAAFLRLAEDAAEVPADFVSALLERLRVLDAGSA
jgi:dethiobiotin synthetase